jgi:hypothetical protein
MFPKVLLSEFWDHCSTTVGQPAQLSPLLIGRGPSLLLFTFSRAAYFALFAFRAYRTYFAAYLTAYFMSSRPSLFLKSLPELISLISSFFELFPTYLYLSLLMLLI